MGLTAQVRVDRGGFRLAAELNVADLEVVAILGPNGAGKTTLLRALAGLEPLVAGRVEVGGRVVEDAQSGVRLPPQRRRTALLFQDYRLFPHLSARENVAFGPRSQGVVATDARVRADAWLARLGLAGLEERRPGQLSGGQAQRVALARALCAAPELLLLDEPLAALDAETRTDVRAALARELADFGGPALLVTHDAVDALSLATRLVVLEGGRIVQDAAPAEVARRPATPYIARLLGLNLLRGTATDGVLALASGGRLVAADEHLRGAALAVVRPSAVVVSRTRPAGSSARNVYVGRLGSLEVLGDRVRLGLAGPPDLLADVTPAAVAELGLAPGEEVWFAVKATEVEVYPDPVPPAGGAALSHGAISP